MERRLAAILAADAVGYSRLMGADEAGTLAVLKAHREELIEPRIDQHHGRVVKLIGDGILAEFPSAVEAVQCAVEIQEAIAARNADLPEASRLAFRIGINLGDVIVEGGDLYGDGVNIAARLEGLAEPGGICVAHSVFSQVKAKVGVEFEDLGHREIKNIDEPVQLFRVLLEGLEAASPAAARSGAPEMDERPSIAVLPFANMSGDPEQDYFADGMTEDIITELARFRNLMVIARNSVFAYKGKAVRVQDVGRDLAVNYVAEGSVRKAGDRVRVTVQLVEAATGNHVWAERYDREYTDIFALQDDLTQAIVAALPGRLESADAERIKRKTPEDMSVYDCLLKAKLCHHRGTSDDNAEGLRLLEQALDTDPEFAGAYAWKACTMAQAYARGYIAYSDELEERLHRYVLRGLSLDENDLECNRILCEFRIEQRRLDEALVVSDKNLRLNPNDPRIVAQRGELLTWLGRPEEGVEWVEKAMRLDPFDADAWAHLLGRALFGARRYREALLAFKRAPNPRYPHHAFMAACCAHAELGDEASRHAAKVLEAKADFSAAAFEQTLYYQDQADRDHVRAGLVKAGLPA